MVTVVCLPDGMRVFIILNREKERVETYALNHQKPTHMH